jgi:hypothetical protein
MLNSLQSNTEEGMPNTSPDLAVCPGEEDEIVSSSFCL